MCRYNLRRPRGLRYRKPTRIATSSQAVVSKLLGMRCTGLHSHEPVLGGSAVTQKAGHYTRQFHMHGLKPLKMSLTSNRPALLMLAEFKSAMRLSARRVRLMCCMKSLRLMRPTSSWMHMSRPLTPKMRSGLPTLGKSALECGQPFVGFMKPRGIGLHEGWHAPCYFQKPVRKRSKLLVNFAVMFVLNVELVRAGGLEPYRRLGLWVSSCMWIS